VKIFVEEWKRLKGKRTGSWRGRYAEFGTVERLVPLIFAALYAAVFVSALLS